MSSSIYLKPSGRVYYASFFIAFLLLSGLLMLAAPFVKFNVYQAMFALLVLNFIASGLAFLYFQQSYIHVEDEIVTVKEGVVLSKMVVIPFNKIDGIKTQYSLIDLLFGLGTIMIDTAGTGAIEVIFSNVPKESIDSFVAMFRNYRQDQADKSSPEPKPGTKNPQPETENPKQETEGGRDSR